MTAWWRGGGGDTPVRLAQCAASTAQPTLHRTGPLAVELDTDKERRPGGLRGGVTVRAESRAPIEWREARTGSSSADSISTFPLGDVTSSSRRELCRRH